MGDTAQQYGCMPGGKSVGVLREINFAHKTAERLSSAGPLAFNDYSLLGEAVKRMDTILEGHKFLTGIKKVMRGPEEGLEYAKTIDIFNDYFGIRKAEERLAILQRIREEIAGAIAAGKVDPDKTRKAAIFFKGLEKHTVDTSQKADLEWLN